MNSSLSQAISLFKKEKYTCVLCKNGETYTSRLHGVLPLINWMSTEMDLEKAVAADKVVGKAAALLYVKLGVKEVYAEILSLDAIFVFNRYGIDFSYGQKADKILNRTRTGICPMEQLVRDIESPELAFCVIKQRIESAL